MPYVIYEPATKAAIRYVQITEDATDANFLNNGEQYVDVIYHPTENKAALPIIVIEPIYYNGMPTQKYDFGIFFTPQEVAKSIEELPEDWDLNSNI